MSTKLFPPALPIGGAAHGFLRLELCHLDGHLTAHPPAFAGFCRDSLVELLHQLTLVPARNRKLARYLAEEPRGYVHLSAQLLRRWLPDYRRYLDYALRSGLLESDNHYRPGEKSRGYRYAASYRRGGALSGFRQVRLRNVTLVRRLQSLQTAAPTFPWAAQARKDYAPLLECLHSESCLLRLHTDAALGFITAERDRVEQDLSQRDAKPKRSRKKAPSTAKPASELKDPEEQFRQRFTSLAQLDARDFRHTLDRYGRLHTVLTRLSSKLRAYVYADGCNALVSIDLTNSQPFFINALLRAEWYGRPWTKGRRGTHPPITLWKEGRSLTEETEEEKNQQASQSKTKQTRPTRSPSEQERPSPPAPRPQSEFYVVQCRRVLGLSDKGLAPFRADVEHFRELTSSGNFYEQMQALLGPVLGRAEVSRDTVKQLMFEVLFSHNTVTSPSKKAFTALFPTVDAVLRVYKSRDYRYLAQLLQTVESHLFLRRLVPLVRRAWPDLPCIYSLHDSLIVPADYSDRVEALMHKYLTRWVGLPPRFKREFWGGSTPPNESAR